MNEDARAPSSAPDGVTAYLMCVFTEMLLGTPVKSAFLRMPGRTFFGRFP